MSMFGDTEPEDAWDANDPVPILIENLVRRLVLLERPHLRSIIPPSLDEQRQVIDLIELRLAIVNRHRGIFEPRQQHRIDQIIEDIEFLRDRLGDG